MLRRGSTRSTCEGRSEDGGDQFAVGHSDLPLLARELERRAGGRVKIVARTSFGGEGASAAGQTPHVKGAVS
jgi:hypothetical protein